MMKQDNHTWQTECVICKVIYVTSCEMLVVVVQVQSSVAKFRSLSLPVAAITQNMGCFRWNQPIIVNHFMSHTQSSTATYNPPSTSPAIRGQDCHCSSSQVTAGDEETTHSSTDKKWGNWDETSDTEPPSLTPSWLSSLSTFSISL